MNQPFRHLAGVERYPRRLRLSREFATPLLIAAGLIGVPLAIGLTHWAAENDDDDAPPAPTVDPNTAYPNNYHLPGAGYYHAPFHAWFPVPFNFYDAGRGYYRGGQWRSTATADASEQQDAQRSGFTARPGTGLRYLGSTFPSSEAVQHANAGAASRHANTILRGGFGHSAHPGHS